MDLSTITEVIETTNLGETNRYLKAGWKMITSSSMTTDSREYNGPMIKYSLGWDSSKGDPVHPAPVY